MTITASVTCRSSLLVATWLFVGNGIEHGVVKLVSYVLITPKNKYVKNTFQLVESDVESCPQDLSQAASSHPGKTVADQCHPCVLPSFG